MKLPLKAIAAFAASPQGRQLIREARSRLDTPENRRRAAEVIAQARARRGSSAASPAPSRLPRLPRRPR